MSVRDEITEFTRGLLDQRLAKITDRQRAFFDRVFPDGVRDDQLVGAIDLCDRTIRKNEQDPSRVEHEADKPAARSGP